MNKKLKRTVLFILPLFILVFCLMALKNKSVINCLLVRYSNDFENLHGNLYVSKDTPAFIKDSIISLIKKADVRVSNFWNEKKRTGTPTIIYLNNKESLSKYSNGNEILTLKSPIGCYIVFSRDRINLDMLSHELLHTELYSKVGFFKSIKEIPAWFDEGLAMQVDYRKEYSEERYIKMVDSLKPQVNLAQISSPVFFYSGNYYLHFLTARHEVDKWYKKEGLSGLNKLILRINNGESFYKTFYK
jgi:hypothetical protein